MAETLEITPLERAARALREATKQVFYVRDPENPTVPPAEYHALGWVAWEDNSDIDRQVYIDQARAVLQAIREPSEDMVSHGREAWAQYATADATSRAIWARMINAALEEG